MGSSVLAVLVNTPVTCRLGHTMAVLKFVAIFLLAQCVTGVRQLRGNNARNPKSLVNTFPFNAKADGHEDHHGEHGDHHGDHGDHGDHHAHEPNQNFDARFPAVAAAGPGADGKKCIDKVEMVEETEYD